MINKVNNIDLQVLSLFTKGYNKEYYIREVAKLLQISSRTALITLNKLEEEGILSAKRRGKIKTYKIKKSLLTKEFFILTEQYKKLQFLDKNHIIKEIVEEIEKLTKGIVIIFGSYAKNKQRKDSDLDVFIVGKYSEKEIKSIGKLYHIDINIKSYPMNIFKKEIETDILLKEVVDNHIIIKSIEEFVQNVTKWIT